MIIKKCLKKFLLVCILWLTSNIGISSAAQVTSVLPVSINVSANCTLSSALLQFGNYDPIGVNATASLNGVTTFQVACTKGANVSITLNNGMYNGNASGVTRAMSDRAGHFLSYELYSDPGRNVVWSQSTPVSFVPTSSAPLVKSVYGRIPAGQNQVAGSYTDVVKVEATF